MVNRSRARRGTLNTSRITVFRISALLVAVCAVTTVKTASANSFNLFGLNGSYSLNAKYAYAIRLEKQSPGDVNSAPRPQIPVPNQLKYPESINYDDGDLNFKQFDTVHNRLSLFGSLGLDLPHNSGLRFSGDAFYDNAYHGHNAYSDARYGGQDHLNTYQQPRDTFTQAAQYYNGGRARLLDAYFYTTFYPTNNSAVDIKIGQQVVGWGQSLFFSGVALAQSPADASEAAVPGASVKSILLPVPQLSMHVRLNNKFSLVGQWKFQYKATELPPTGAFTTVSDLIGPGAKFAYGIKNPAYLSNLSSFDLTDPSQLSSLANLLDQALLGANTQTGPLYTLAQDALSGPLGSAVAALPTISLPALANLLDAPKGFPVKRGANIDPRRWNFDQWGVGLRYNLNYTTSFALYHLNYDDPNPTVTQTFGYPTVINAHDGVPKITTQALGLEFPVTYHVKHYRNLKLDAVDFSTTLLGLNVAGSFMYRRGIDVLVDVNDGLTGMIPTPTRADAFQSDLNAIYAAGPHFFWDSLSIVGELGFIHVFNIQPEKSVAGPDKGKEYDHLSAGYSKNAAAFASLATFTIQGVFPGWDLQIPLSFQDEIYHKAALNGAFGSLMGGNDIRLGLSFDFTYLQNLTLGLTYSGYLGPANFRDHPYQDRDTLAVTAKYDFF